MFPLSLIRDSRLLTAEIRATQVKREGGHVQGPGKEGMLDENAQVSSEDDVTYADGSVHQHHWMKALPAHSTKASYP